MKNFVAAIFCLLVVQPIQSSEPTYNGHPLSEWLVLDLKSQASAENAIRQIGTNGIPTLIDILGAKESNKRKVLAKLDNEELKQEFSSKDSNLADLRNLAVNGFGILGANAESAVPQITKLFYDQETRFEATRALIRVGPRGFSVLTNALADEDSSVRNPLIWVIGQEGGDPKVVTQLLIKSLKDSDVVNQGNTATFLADRDPAIAIPALIALLDENHTNFVTVIGAAKGLSSYGAAAKAAAPILLSIYTNTWDVELIWALKAIDMETAAKAEEFLVNSGPLSSARSGYTITMLPNGKELIVGGYIHTEFPTIKNRYLSSVELLDPTTGKWTETGEMNSARYDHTATLLPDGKVLVTGGYDRAYGKTLSSKALYDPAAEKWTVITNK